MRTSLDRYRARCLRCLEWDVRCARALHGGVQSRSLLGLLQACSRGGDAWAWAAAIALVQLLGGAAARQCVPLLAAVGALNLAVYYAVKLSIRRRRPFDGGAAAVVSARMAAPDRFSFPSGHALHAASFTLLLCSFYPALAPLLVPLAACIALSRVVLGLHYPSDVVVGAAIGFGTALLGLHLAA